MRQPRSSRHFQGVGQVLSLLLVALGCAACSGIQNPSFPLTTDEAEKALAEMEARPKTLVRPLVIVGGFADPGLASGSIRDIVAPCFNGGEIVTIETDGVETFDEARTRLIDVVKARFPDPGGDPLATAEVDVIGNSMGGLVALYATAPRVDEPALRAVRLFTIGTPFQGATAAQLLPVNGMVRDMQPGSTFLLRLDGLVAQESVALVPYVRHDDAIVGAINAAPSTMTAWWVPGEFLASGHLTTFGDRRILADIVRRLRDEPTFTREPAEPLPDPDAAPGGDW